MTESTDREPMAATTHVKALINGVASGAVLVAVIGLMLLARRNTDVDLGLHLAIGRLLDAGGEVASAASLDGLTILADQPYVATQWLAEIIGYRAWLAWELNGILVLRLLCIVTLVVTLAWGCRSAAGLTPTLAATSVAVFGSAMAWGERPQLAGLAAFAITSALLWRSIDHPRLSVLIVPVTWVWAMIHGTWTIGVALVGLFAVGAALEGDIRRALTLAVQAVLALVAAALTPLGLAAITTPFTVAIAVRADVNEWAPPALTNPFLLAALAGAAVVVFSWRRRRPVPTHVLLWVFAVVLALSMVRLVAFGAVALAPLLAMALDRPRGATEAGLDWRTERTIWIGVGAIGVLVTGAVTLLAPPALPVGTPMTAALDELPPGTRVAAEPRLSGWVLWAHPHLSVFKDLRAEAYSAETAAAYGSFNDAERGWEAYAQEQRIDTVLVDAGEPLAEALPGSQGWQLAQTHDGIELWVRAR